MYCTVPAALEAGEGTTTPTAVLASDETAGSTGS